MGKKISDFYGRRKGNLTPRRCRSEIKAMCSNNLSYSVALFARPLADVYLLGD